MAPPGEAIPSLKPFRWREGEENPTARTISVTEAGRLSFSCPTCGSTVYPDPSRIDSLVGLSVQCPGCKNISHVPGGFASGSPSPDLKITGGVLVPIEQLAEWFYAHPVRKSLFDTRETDLLAHDGLRGFCASCLHRFRGNILYQFCVVSWMTPYSTGLLFTAHSPESKRDMEALLEGKCPSCGCDRIIAILADIPRYVRDWLHRKVRIADLRRRIEEVRAEMDRADHLGDLNRAAELRYGVLLNLERELAAQEGDEPNR